MLRFRDREIPTYCLLPRSLSSDPGRTRTPERTVRHSAGAFGQAGRERNPIIVSAIWRASSAAGRFDSHPATSPDFVLRIAFRLTATVPGTIGGSHDSSSESVRPAPVQ